MSKLTSILLPYMMMATTSRGNDLRSEDIDTHPAQPVIPKGCKEYWFNTNGGFTNGLSGPEKILKTDVVYYCIASSDAAAKKKFDKFEKNLVD
jgi:hypothetical protein